MYEKSRVTNMRSTRYVVKSPWCLPERDHWQCEIISASEMNMMGDTHFHQIRVYMGLKFSKG